MNTPLLNEFEVTRKKIYPKLKAGPESTNERDEGMKTLVESCVRRLGNTDRNLSIERTGKDGAHQPGHLADLLNG